MEGGSGGGPDGSPGVFCPVDDAVGVCAVLLLSVCKAPPVPCVCVGLLRCMCIGDTTFDSPVVPDALCWLCV